MTTDNRNEALDFTKGVLVILMVVYHWGNYFLGPVEHFYEYLRFLSPSFIFLSGCVLSMMYAVKYDLNDPRLYKRLIVRGVKILILFTALNAAMHACLAGSSHRGTEIGLNVFWSEWYGIYVTGNSQVAAFVVLIAISYTLIGATGLLWVSRFGKALVAGIAVLMCVAVEICERNGLISRNFDFLSFGVLGLAIGFAGLDRLNKVASYRLTIALLYLGYLVLVTVRGPTYWVQIIGVCLSLLLIYSIGMINAGKGTVRAGMILMGKYSLVGYVGQIAILQLLRVVARHFTPSAGLSAMALLVGLCLTGLLIVVLDIARRKSKMTDKLYKFVFA